MAEVENEAIEIPNVATDNAIAEFNTYEEYLDSQITPLDLYYLEVINRRVVLRCLMTSRLLNQSHIRIKNWPDSWWNWGTAEPEIQSNEMTLRIGRERLSRFGSQKDRLQRPSRVPARICRIRHSCRL